MYDLEEMGTQVQDSCTTGSMIVPHRGSYGRDRWIWRLLLLSLDSDASSWREVTLTN